jgi:probable rRNA maturation factor
MPVEIARQGEGRKYPAFRFRKIAQAILASLGLEDAELSLVLTGNSAMQKLNAQYRQKDYPTDVLSFPVEGAMPSDHRLLGDVIISVEKAREQAKARGHTVEQEMITLLIHGIVHLLGYDHERSARDARAMTRVEKRIHRQLCERGLITV